jgi:uncharacterized protein
LTLSIDVAGGAAAEAAADSPSLTPAAPRLHYWSWWLPVFTAVWLALYWHAFPDPVGLAARNWPLILVGVGGAILGNATAVGGGLIFIPVLVLAYHLPPVDSLKLALVSQSIGMSSGALGWLRRRAVPLNALPVAVPALIIGATVSTLVLHPRPMLVKGLFGPMSIAVGLLTLYMLERHPGQREVPARAYPSLAAVAVVGGLLTGWVAIGEGELVAAYLMIRYRLEPARGIALGATLLACNSIFLAALYVGIVGGVPWELAAFTILGCAWGGRLGPFLTQWVSAHRLKVGFAWIAIADGLLFFLQFLFSRH